PTNAQRPRLGASWAKRRSGTRSEGLDRTVGNDWRRFLTMTQSLTLPLKWHGGKQYLAAKIVALMPPHLHFVEAYFGGGAVLFAHDPEDPRLWLKPAPAHLTGISELVNALHGRLMSFWRVLQEPALFEMFYRRVALTPLARPAWEAAHAHAYGQDAVTDA